MSETPQSTLRIREWKGLVSNRGPFFPQPGAAKVQINLRCISPGILEVRGGMRPLKYTR
jgi:hypothetical protein